MRDALEMKLSNQFEKYIIKLDTRM